MTKIVTAIFLIPLLFATALSADSITFFGSSIPLRDCRVAAIQSARVQYVDPNNRRQMRDIREISVISFTGLTELDEAERLLGDDRPGEALLQMLRALRKAETDVQRLWIRYRLAQVHDGLGQYVQSLAHVAEIYRMTGSVDWTFLKPFTKPAAASYAAAREAMTNLERARREVRSPQMHSIIDSFIDTLRPIHDEAARGYNGEPIPIGSTLSGISIDLIESTASGSPEEAVTTAAIGETGNDAGDMNHGNDDSTALARPEEQIRQPAQPTETASRATTPVRPGAAPAPNAPEAIDRLLESSDFDGALALCDRVADAPGRRNLGQFLVQYGHALAGIGRTEDAAVMFTRCAVLYDGTPQAVGALIETARIYRDTYHQPATARRLLERAVDRATMLELESDAAIARELIASLNDIDF